MTITILTGDCRKLLPELHGDVIITDPPYGVTSHKWDSWPTGWPELARAAAPHMWCFGVQSMWLRRASEFAGWQYAEEIVWEKHNGSGSPTPGRFLQVHELALHWYQPPWADVYAHAPRLPYDGPLRADIGSGSKNAPHRGAYKDREWADDGTRLARSVQRFRSSHGVGNHETQKPVGLLDILVRASCPPGGTVIDLFAGSGAVCAAAEIAGRNSIGVEIDPAKADILRARPFAAVAPRTPAEIRRARGDGQRFYGLTEDELFMAVGEE